MSQPRKKRTIIFEIRITVFTDFMQDFLTNSIRACVTGIAGYEKSQGRVTNFELNERVIDSKTSEPFKRTL